MKHELTTCINCGWVHFKVSTEYIASWKKEWEDLWSTMSQDDKESFGVTKAPPSDSSYYRCDFCNGSYRNFRDFKDGDCPTGCTVGPILDRDE